MAKYTFPEQKTVLSNKAYSGEALARIIEEVSRHPRPFTGFVKVVGAGGTFHFLFFLQSDVYAAGRFDGSKPQGIAIGDFFASIAAAREELVMSVQETDPILLKCLLIFLQDEPTAKAPATLLDLEQLVNRIVAENGDAMIVLEKERALNFFFIKNGMTAQPHWADANWHSPDDLSATEQLLLYAFESHSSPVVAYIYRNVTTEKATDCDELDTARLLAMAKQTAKATASPDAAGASPAVQRSQPTVTVEVVSGEHKGMRLSAVMPCILGRKDCDLVIADGLISRRHARLEQIDGVVMIEDLGSTNGTYLNGTQIKRAPLTPADRFALGETALRLIV